MDETLQADLRRFLNDDERRSAALLSAGYQGAAFLFESADIRLVIKEAGGGFFTGWFHQLMLRREAAVYQLINGISGVPHSPGMLDNTWLILEYIDGKSLKDERHNLGAVEVFFAELLQILHDFHDLGIAHGDLKRAGNILVTQDERPVVIDFGTAVNRNGSLFDRLIFRLVRRFDYNAWVKLKYDRDYSAISDEDQRWYRPTVIETVFRQLRRFWRTITFRKARKRREYERNNS